jgi:hypothetical protein
MLTSSNSYNAYFWNVGVKYNKKIPKYQSTGSAYCNYRSSSSGGGGGAAGGGSVGGLCCLLCSAAVLVFGTSSSKVNKTTVEPMLELILKQMLRKRLSKLLPLLW